MENFDVIVIGGGQSGLAMGYYLRRTNSSPYVLGKLINTRGDLNEDVLENILRIFR